MKCFSCEPDVDAYQHAVTNTAGLSNVQLFNETSQQFLKRVVGDPEIVKKDAMFWLDAHGYGFEWPLIEEISAITQNWERAYVFIDDYLVPGFDCFKYDNYRGQICSYEYVKEALHSGHTYRRYYPMYTDRTSTHHPLTGWGLIEFGHSTEIVLPDHLQNRIERVQ